MKTELPDRLVSTPACFIVNPSAGRGAVAELEKAINRTFGDQGEVYTTKQPGEAQEIVSKAGSEGRLVVAAGGDGTVNAIINAAMAAPERPTLGVVPLGTANNFCRSLGVPLNLEEAVRCVRDGTASGVDLVEVRTEQKKLYYATVATAGNADRVIDALEENEKQQWGAWCYLRAALPILTDLQAYPLRVEADGEPMGDFRIWNLLVANTRYAGGGIDVAPHAALDNGLLDLVLISEGPGLDLLSLTSGYLTSGYLEHERVTHRQATRVTVRSERELRWLVDGEMIAGSDFEFAVAPRALQVLRPTE
ncbi:Diacylglycerol kinase [Pseudobythopirellula maris]|uniref:Diacylglycerol kinase n=1 Tax=Pseudobythopirellula maris TaxID=2527991 RepID=A0A5C5ZNH5_9BACT|nr:diacylglycerol kinase family protein [Pseudobythopirellula maris]TWT89064.1 Diacylglycerol kinase [Pseudobythopirellula maris]